MTLDILLFSYIQNDQTLKDIYQLPPPSISAEDFREKYNRDPRIPSPVPQPEETLDIHSVSNECITSTLVLCVYLFSATELQYHHVFIHSIPDRLIKSENSEFEEFHDFI